MKKSNGPIDELLDIRAHLLGMGVEVQAKLTMGDPKHQFVPPNELRRRRDNQEELLAHLEGKAFKLPPKTLEALKNVIGRPLPTVHSPHRSEAGGNWVLSDLHEMEQAIKTEKGDVLLKDSEGFKKITEVKDGFITVGQMRILIAQCRKDFAARASELQMILHIKDDDLSVKNLKRYIANVGREIGEKSNFYVIQPRDIEELNLPRITHKDLDFLDADDMPETISDMVRDIMATSAGGEADDEGEVVHFRRVGNPNAKEAVQIMPAMARLFPGLKFDVLLDSSTPQSTAGELANIQSAIVMALDSMTNHAWESHYSLVVIRGKRQVVMLGIHGNEEALVKKAMPTFVKWKHDLVERMI